MDMDYQAALRLKDAELEERATLLLKTKAAIEQLQEELHGSRFENGRLRKAVEQQSDAAAAAQQHAHLIEQELEAKRREAADMLRDALAGKRKCNELQDALVAAKEVHRTEVAALGSKLHKAEQATAAAQADAAAAQQQVSALQHAAAGREAALANQQADISDLQRQRQASAASASDAQQQATGLKQHCQTLQTRVQELQLKLASETAELQRRLSEAVQLRTTCQQQLADASEALKEERAQYGLDIKAWSRKVDEQQQDWADRLAHCEGSWQARMQKQAGEAKAALESSKKDWARKFYLAEGDWCKKLQATTEQWAARLDATCSDWHQRYQAEKAAWEAQSKHMLEEVAARLTAQEQAHAQEMEQLRQQRTAELQAAHAASQAELHATVQAWTEKRDAALEAARLEHNTALGAWQVAAAQRERSLQDQLQEAQRLASERVARIEQECTGKLEAAEHRWEQDKSHLEQQWSDACRLQHARQGAQQAQAVQRSKVEAVLASIVGRITDLAARQAKQEKKRRQLLEQVTALQAATDVEGRQRREAEQALHTASHLFKKELQEKNIQLEQLRSEASSLRTSGCIGQLCLPAMATSLLMPGSPVAESPRIAAAWASPGLYTSPGLRRAPGKGGLRSVGTEVALLRAARQEYQRALAEQQEIKAAMLSAINDAASDPETAGLPRPRPAAATAAASSLRQVLESLPTSAPVPGAQRALFV